MRREECRNFIGNDWRGRNLNAESIYSLINELKIQLKLNPTKLKMKIAMVRKNDVVVNSSGGIDYAHIRVHGKYFKGREAITLNRDGFVGFAGWADKDNVQPILKAFEAWLSSENHGIGPF